MNSAWAMLVRLMAVKNSVMLRPKNSPAGSTSRHVCGRRRRAAGAHPAHGDHDPPQHDGDEHPPEREHRARRVGPLDERRAAGEGEDGQQHRQDADRRERRAATSADVRRPTAAVSARHGRRSRRLGGPVDVGLDVDRSGRSAPPRAAPRSAPSIAPASSSTLRSGSNSSLAATSSSSGPRCCGAEVDEPAHAVASSSVRVIRSRSSVGRRLADQQALHLDRQHDGDDDEQDADGDRARRRPSAGRR